MHRREQNIWIKFQNQYVYNRNRFKKVHYIYRLIEYEQHIFPCILKIQFCPFNCLYHFHRNFVLYQILILTVLKALNDAWTSNENNTQFDWQVQPAACVTRWPRLCVLIVHSQIVLVIDVKTIQNKTACLLQHDNITKSWFKKKYVIYC